MQPHPSGPKPSRASGPVTDTRTLEVSDTAVLLALVGPSGERLRILSTVLGVEATQRGNAILLGGPRAPLDLAERFLAETATLLRQGKSFSTDDFTRNLRQLASGETAHMEDLFDVALKMPAMARAISPKTASQRAYVKAILTHDLTFAIGPAGTGKTYLAMAAAVSALLERRVKRIILTRPAVEAGEKLGFLPGDLAEKVNPYLRPLFDAMGDMLDVDRAQGFIARGLIEVAPLAFMRGRTLSDAFVILDEAQNTTTEQMRMFLTRLGYGSRAVVTGDITQVDLPRGVRSGLREARELLDGVEGIAVCSFTDVDVVRHPLVQRIVLAYERHDAQRRATATKEQGHGAEGEGAPGRRTSDE
jgi:phosphate starvation-inducible protein PhoH and related proteins